MQVREKIAHLLLGKSSPKRRHQAFARQHDAAHFRIGGRNSAWQLSALENPMQVRRNFLEIEVVLLVAMRTSARVQMLALRLLRRKPVRRVTPAHNSRGNYDADHPLQVTAT